MPYCSAADIRAQVNMVSNADDPSITALIAAAEMAINNFCGRPDGFVSLTVATARLYTGSGLTYQWIDECTSVTEVEVKDASTDSVYVTWAATDYITASGDPAYPNFNRTPYTLLIVDPTGDYSVFTGGKFSSQRGFPPESDAVRGIPTVQITAKWGYATAVPAAIKQATVTQAAIWYKRGQGFWSKVLAQNEMGQMDYDTYLDPAVKLLVWAGRYVRKAGTAGRR